MSNAKVHKDSSLTPVEYPASSIPRLRKRCSYSIASSQTSVSTEPLYMVSKPHFDKRYGHSISHPTRSLSASNAT